MHNIFYGKSLEEIEDFFKSILTSYKDDEEKITEVKELIQEVKENDNNEIKEKIEYYNVNEDITENAVKQDNVTDLVVENKQAETFGKMEMMPAKCEMNEKATKMFMRIVDDMFSLHKFLMHMLKLCNSSRDDIEIKKLIVKMDKAKIKFLKMCGEMNMEIEPKTQDFFSVRNYDLALKIARDNTEKILDNLILLLFLVSPRGMDNDMMLLMIVMLTSHEKLNELLLNRC